MGFRCKEKISPERWKYLQSSNSADLKCFYNNVEYFGRMRYGSRNKALKALKDVTGWVTTSQTVKCYLRGTYTDSSLTALKAWSMLFNEPLYLLLYRDYEAEARAKEGIG